MIPLFIAKSCYTLEMYIFAKYRDKYIKILPKNYDFKFEIKNFKQKFFEQQNAINEKAFQVFLIFFLTFLVIIPLVYMSQQSTLI